MLEKIIGIVLIVSAYFSNVNVPGLYKQLSHNIEKILTNSDGKALSYTISNSELMKLSEELFLKDNNLAEYITVNLQNKVEGNSNDDFAPELLLKVDPKMWNIKRVQLFKALLDNYEQNTHIIEDRTSQEYEEEQMFLSYLMNSDVMVHLMAFLSEKGLVSSDINQQGKLISKLWFDVYPREKGKLSSSGFEHIFLSEIRKTKILGLHNWIYFHTKEMENIANYLGYIRNINFNNKASILKYSFNISTLHKPVSSMFIGTSPELEIAYYTLCFVTKAPKNCNLSINGKKFSITTYIKDYNGERLIASAYPNI